MILILLRVNSLDHEMEVKILEVIPKIKEKTKKKTKERINKRKLTRKMNTRLKKGKIVNIIKILRAALKKENKTITIIAKEVLDTRAKINTKKKTSLTMLVLL